MLSQPGSFLPIMFAFLFGFAAIRAEDIPNGIMPQKRQVVGTGATTSNTPDPTSDPPPTSTNPPVDSDTVTSIPVTSNTPAGPTTSDVPTTDLTSNTGGGANTNTNTNTNDNNNNNNGNTDADSTTNSNVQTTQGKDNSVVKVGSTTVDPNSLTRKTTVRAPLVTKETAHRTLTSTWTSNGQVYSSTYVTESVFKSTTGFATATINPSLAHEGGDGSNLSTNTKKVIGGVVGGIGGAILIGGLAFVAWRLWGKKKDAQELPQDDMYSNDSMSAQKRMSGNTLDTYSEPYSNPNGAVNTASNF